MEKKYLKEIESIARKYDYWDEAKSPYAFLVSYENDANPGIAHKFITKRMKGGTLFRECINKMMNNFTPDVIIIDEFTGIKGNALSNYPLRIRVSDEPAPGGTTANMPMMQPIVAPSAIDNVFEGLSGIEGFEGVKNGLGALLAFERERHTKDMMIDRLNYDRKFTELELKNHISALEEKLEKLTTENRELDDDLRQTRLSLESLETANEELKEENEQYKPNRLIKDVGIGAITNIAMQLATKSPILKGLLGIDEDVNQSTSGPNQSQSKVESQITEATPKDNTIREISEVLSTWTDASIEHLIHVMVFMENNPEGQLELLELINEKSLQPKEA
ncbi:hypothetical protein BY457_11115 [Marinilabilia salmonicolor]|jgi:hypothetical protein|uniref:hypothetical protein n=1 Tax=Marinilabilia salmonicolor TaxID=989 RepID=UPI000D04C547|nr:hypothetical protein [Marinilabilia salmonicolor]PRY97735.1 hypothetical protein BY457_11115 [Marinilabilia salmonicolor]